MKIDAHKVHEAVMDCLYLPTELDGHERPADAVMVQGILHTFGFHPARLESHRVDVSRWLAALPSEFHASAGGGMSFLNACYDDTGAHWGEHRNMDELFVLGMALGLVKCCMPREMWDVLPGGMPYYVVLTPSE